MFVAESWLFPIFLVVKVTTQFLSFNGKKRLVTTHPHLGSPIPLLNVASSKTFFPHCKPKLAPRSQHRLL